MLPLGAMAVLPISQIVRCYVKLIIEQREINDDFSFVGCFELMKDLLKKLSGDFCVSAQLFYGLQILQGEYPFAIISSLEPL